VAAILGIEAISLTDSGRYHDAVDTFHRSIALAEDADDPRQAAWSLTLLARAQLQHGDLDSGQITIARARALVSAERWTAFLPLVLVLSAEFDLHGGRLEEAGEQLTCAWTIASELHDRCWLSVTGRGLGLLAERRGDVQEAVAWLDGACATPSDNPQTCRWMEISALDSLCEVSVRHRLPQARSLVAQLSGVATSAAMPHYLARSRTYTTRLNARSPVRGNRQ